MADQASDMFARLNVENLDLLWLFASYADEWLATDGVASPCEAVERVFTLYPVSVGSRSQELANLHCRVGTSAAPQLVGLHQALGGI